MRREAEISSQLKHHAVTIFHGLFVQEGRLTDPLADYYLVSGFVKGGLARSYLAEHRTPVVAEKLVRYAIISAGMLSLTVVIVDGSFEI